MMQERRAGGRPIQIFLESMMTDGQDGYSIGWLNPPEEGQ